MEDEGLGQVTRSHEEQHEDEDNEMDPFYDDYGETEDEAPPPAQAHVCGAAAEEAALPDAYRPESERVGLGVGSGGGLPVAGDAPPSPSLPHEDEEEGGEEEQEPPDVGFGWELSLGDQGLGSWYGPEDQGFDDTAQPPEDSDPPQGPEEAPMETEGEGLPARDVDVGLGMGEGTRPQGVMGEASHEEVAVTEPAGCLDWHLTTPSGEGRAEWEAAAMPLPQSQACRGGGGSPAPAQSLPPPVEPGSGVPPAVAADQPEPTTSPECGTVRSSPTSSSDRHAVESDGCKRPHHDGLQEPPETGVTETRPGPPGGLQSEGTGGRLDAEGPVASERGRSQCPSSTPCDGNEPSASAGGEETPRDEVRAWQQLGR